MFLAKLHTVSNSLTRSELQIADYIKNHIQEMKTVTWPIYYYTLFQEVRLCQFS